MSFYGKLAMCARRQGHTEKQGTAFPPIVGQETGLGYTGVEKCERQRCGPCLERRILWRGRAVGQINTNRTLDVNRSRAEMKVGFRQVMTLMASLFDGRAG